MLEENLKSGTMSPAEVAVNIMSFLSVELAAQSPSAETRFFQIFEMLCARVFGPISLNPKDNYRHENNIGWMIRPQRWERPVSSSAVSSSSRAGVRRVGSSSSLSRISTVYSIKDDPVVILLGAQAEFSSSRSSSSSQQQKALTFLQALAMEAAHRPNVRYRFPFKGLPEPMQTDWLALIDGMMMSGGAVGANSIGGQGQMRSDGASSSPLHIGKKNNTPSTNSMALMGHLFRVGPLQQSALVQYYQTQKAKKGGGGSPASPFVGLSSSITPSSASPFGSQSQQQQPPMATASSSSSKTKDAAPAVQLSMLEYYLLVFLRYPLYRPTEVVKATSSSTTSSTSSTGGPYSTRHPSLSSSSPRRYTLYGEQVYEEILRSYIMYYIPVRAYSGSFHGFEPVERPNELFIRLIVALWLEGQNLLSSTEAAISLFRQRRGDAAVVAGGVGLDKSFEIVQGSYRPLPAMIVRALKRVIDRVLLDGAIADKAKDISSGLNTSSSTSGHVLCLSPAMTVLQTPFYNFIRTVFRYESVHSSSTTSATFNDALDMWLCWLEPWNVQWKTRKSATTTSRIAGKLSSPFKKSQSVVGELTKPSSKKKSLYKPFWEPYIASNLHLYTVPLALFLRRAREFDFSPKKYKSSLDTVLRVLRVYTPEVVDAINRLLSCRSSLNNSKSALLFEFVKKHEENLGPYVPPVAGDWSLSACGEDMQVLWDEIIAQHKKRLDQADFADQIAAYINKFFTDMGNPVGEDKELEMVAVSAKALVGRDFSIITASKGASSTATVTKDSAGSPDFARTEDGELSDIGRSGLLQGRDKCRVEDTEDYGDRMRSLPQSNEIKILVSLTVQLSDYLNEKLDQRVRSTAKQNTALGQLAGRLLPNRINLRFLADWRNLWFILFCLWLGKKCIV